MSCRTNFFIGLTTMFEQGVQLFNLEFTSERSMYVRNWLDLDIRKDSICKLLGRGLCCPLHTYVCPG